VFPSAASSIVIIIELGFVHHEKMKPMRENVVQRTITSIGINSFIVYEGGVHGNSEESRE
jgi:hypothetical protein